MYAKAYWKDRVVQRPRTYTRVVNDDGSWTFSDAPGTITEPGTAISAANLNRIEEGLQHLSAAFDMFSTIMQAQLRAHEDSNNEKIGHGVISGLLVTAQSTPNMTVAISAGIAYTPAQERFSVPAKASLAINAANATNPRIDLIYLSSDGKISYLAGSAAASPSAPATPSGALRLAEIYVFAGDTSITNTKIIMRRKSIMSEEPFYPTLINGWTADSMAPVRISKDATGRVTVEGGLIGGSGIAFYFPAGYRPAADRGFAVFTSSTTSPGMVRISANGAFNVLNYTTFISFSISFIALQ